MHHEGRLDFRDGEAEWMTGDNTGTVSPIVGYIKDTRTVTLLLPTSAMAWRFCQSA